MNKIVNNPVVLVLEDGSRVERLYYTRSACDHGWEYTGDILPGDILRVYRHAAGYVGRRVVRVFTPATY